MPGCPRGGRRGAGRRRARSPPRSARIVPCDRTATPCGAPRPPAPPSRPAGRRAAPWPPLASDRVTRRLWRRGRGLADSRAAAPLSSAGICCPSATRPASVIGAIHEAWGTRGGHERRDAAGSAGGATRHPTALPTRGTPAAALGRDEPGRGAGARGVRGSTTPTVRIRRRGPRGPARGFAATIHRGACQRLGPMAPAGAIGLVARARGLPSPRAGPRSSRRNGGAGSPASIEARALRPHRMDETHA